MKVKREREGFRPITIILETKAEAEALWHILNCNYLYSLRSYTETRHISSHMLSGMKSQFWQLLDNNFRPEKKKDY